MLAGLYYLGHRMNTGKTLFAQVMEYVPWKTFGRIIERHNGDSGVRTLSCADVFRVMAFAQLTWRESLRDIEVCLTSNQTKLFHMGMNNVPARSTLADALNLRDWRIYHALAMRLIANARELYVKEPMSVDLDATVYALDSTTIDLCLSLFDWAPFRSTKAAVKMHTLLDLRGAIPAFIHVSDGKLGDVNVLDILPLEAGAFYIMDRGYLDFARLFKLHQQHLRIKRFLATSENAVKTQIWCAVSTYVLIAIVKKELHLDASLYTCLQILSVSIFEKTQLLAAVQPDRSQITPPSIDNQLILFDF